MKCFNYLTNYLAVQSGNTIQKVMETYRIVEIIAYMYSIDLIPRIYKGRITHQEKVKRKAEDFDRHLSKEDVGMSN